MHMMQIVRKAEMTVTLKLMRNIVQIPPHGILGQKLHHYIQASFVRTNFVVVILKQGRVVQICCTPRTRITTLSTME